MNDDKTWRWHVLTTGKFQTLIINLNDVTCWEVAWWSRVRWSRVRWRRVRWSRVRWSRVRWRRVRWRRVRWSRVRWRRVCLCSFESTLCFSCCLFYPSVMCFYCHLDWFCFIHPFELWIFNKLLVFFLLHILYFCVSQLNHLLRMYK